MRSIKQALDAEGHALLEMPTGTGKTVCLLSLITSYQYANPGAGKLVYCTRTVPEMNAVMEELGTVLAYRAKELKLDVPASNQNISNPAVSRQTSGAQPMDIEDSAGATSSTPDPSPSKSQRKGNKRRKTYKRKENLNPNLGPISNHGNGAGGSRLSVSVVGGTCAFMRE